MMKRLLPFLVAFTLLASPAGALKMIIWDRDMQTTLGAGESSANKFNVQLIRNFSGPVIVIFSQTDEEKRSASYSGLQNRYDGVLKNGQLTLMPEPPETPDRQDVKPAAAASSSAPAGTAQSSAKAVGLTLSKLLQQFKLTVDVKTTSQSNPAQENSPLAPGAANTASGNSRSGLMKSLELKGK